MPVTRRIVLVGATGAFGGRLARLLAPWPEVELVLAARRTELLSALAVELACEAAVFDRDHPAALASLRPWLVVDAAGPFQPSDFRLVRAAIAAGAHYVDIADGRNFVNAFPRVLDGAAKAAGVLAVTGASSTPALSNAALDAIAAGWRRIDKVTVAISPGARAPRGLSVIQAILSYVGRPVTVWAGGVWRVEPGWSGLRRMRFPGLGPRLVSLCETPDLDLMAQRARTDARFLAGLESGVLHLGLWLLSWPVRLGLIESLEPFAKPMRRIADLFAPLGSDRGGMVVEATGAGADGEGRWARWTLYAPADAGPTTPVAAAAAVVRGLLEGRLTVRGARVCVGLLTLEDIMAELRGLPIETQVEARAFSWPTLLRRLLGRDVRRLPREVVRVHSRRKPRTFRGSGRARGSKAPLARLARLVVGLPEPGAYPNLAVSIAPVPGGEIWTRDFGLRRFTSHLVGLDAPGHFEERLGPLRFAFAIDPRPDGFRWRFLGWRLGLFPLPRAVAPRIRAYSFGRAGGYRFRAVAAHPWLGLIFAYGGRLDA